MKSMLIKFKIIIILLFIVSCQKEGNLHEDNALHGDHVPQIKSHISYDEFKHKLLKYNKLEEFENNFSNYTKDGNEDYIVYINTDEITTFTTDSLTTYTLSAVTSDQDHLSFTNVVYVEKGNELFTGFLKYYPTEEWISSLLSGDELPFEGLVNLIDAEGNILASENINGDYMPKGLVECFFSSEPIWQACYGQSCPCTDGNGYLVGWNFTIDCTGGGSGGGYPGGGDPGGGGGGNPGGGNPGQGDLPTDPLEWALFMQLHALLGAGNFYLDPDLDPNNSVHFDTFEDFEDFITAEPDFDSYGTSQQDGTYTTVCDVSYPGTVTSLRFFVNHTLKSPGQNYVLHSITYLYTGLTILTDWQLVSNSVNINSNIATIDIYGEFTVGAHINGIGIYGSQFQHYRIEISILTGEIVDMYRVE